MKERPILFNAAMVRAVLDGSKTQTRRIVKPWADRAGMMEGGHVGKVRDGSWMWSTIPVDQWDAALPATYMDGGGLLCPYGVPGDRLWVRETWAKPGEVGDNTEYRADNPDPLAAKWRPSIHMPRWASRITLEVTDARVERLNDISEEDARAEGCPVDHVGRRYDPPAADPWQGYARASFSLLWSEINGAASLAANPWVWVVSFRRVVVAAAARLIATVAKKRGTT